MSVSRRNRINHAILAPLAALMLSGCATAYQDRDAEPPLKGLAMMGGLATTVPEAKDFVKESRPETLDYIPIGVRPEDVDGIRKPMTEEELLLLKKKLEAGQRQNSTIPAGE